MTGKVGVGDMGLKSQCVLNRCPLFFYAHLVTAVCDMVLKSRLCTHPLLCVCGRCRSLLTAPLPC